MVPELRGVRRLAWLVVTTDGGARLDRRFAVLWTSSTASAFGTGLATVATPLFVASQTSDPLLVSSAAAVTWLPWLLFALPGGAGWPCCRRTSRSTWSARSSRG